MGFELKCVIYIPLVSLIGVLVLQHALIFDHQFKKSTMLVVRGGYNTASVFLEIIRKLKDVMFNLVLLIHINERVSFCLFLEMCKKTV